MDRVDLRLGDCLEVMKTLADNSVDAIVTDPPYELGFMGKSWDSTGIASNVEMWRECLRVLKPGGHLLAFSGSRTYHRMACAIEDAGFEIRDQIMWIYGSGFPKSLDVSKAIDKAAGAERGVIGTDDKPRPTYTTGNIGGKAVANEYNITAPATDAARQWQGWGSALKPAHEPLVMARKPLVGTVAANVLVHGVGAINIDGCRVDTDDVRTVSGSRSGNIGWGTGNKDGNRYEGGRWPANLIHAGIDEQWARYFYCAKASKKDRNEGCEHIAQKQYSHDGRQTPIDNAYQRNSSSNNHPTVKPTDLMRYLCRLVTPPDGVVLDPFAGSGSTGKAAMLEGFKFIGIEKDPEYFEIAKARIAHASEVSA